MADILIPFAARHFDVLPQNAVANLPNKAIRLEVVADIKAVSNTPDRKTAEELLQACNQKYTTSVPAYWPDWKINRRKDVYPLIILLSIAELSGPTTD